MILSGLAAVRASATSAFGYRRLDVAGPGSRRETIVRGELGADRRGEPVPDVDRRRWRIGCGRCRPWPTRRSRSPCPTRSVCGWYEREPILVWQIGGAALPVDADRVAFVVADAPVDLPVIDDRRERSDRRRPAGRPGQRRSAAARHGRHRVGPRPGRLRRRDPARLASPGDVGSGAAGLQRDDRRRPRLHGRQRAGRLDRDFGFYTPTIRKTDLIPGQVRLLRSLLAGREAVDRHGDPRRRPRGDVHPEDGTVTAAGRSATRSSRVAGRSAASSSLAETHPKRGRRGVFLPLAGLLVGVLPGYVLNVNVSFEFSPLHGRGDPRRARFGPRCGPRRARRRLRQSDLHQRLHHERARRRHPHVHRRSAQPGPVPGGPDQLRVRIFQNVALIRRHFL